MKEKRSRNSNLENETTAVSNGPLVEEIDFEEVNPDLPHYDKYNPDAPPATTHIYETEMNFYDEHQEEYKAQVKVTQKDPNCCVYFSVEFGIIVI